MVSDNGLLLALLVLRFLILTKSFSSSESASSNSLSSPNEPGVSSLKLLSLLLSPDPSSDPGGESTTDVLRIRERFLFGLLVLSAGEFSNSN